MQAEEPKDERKLRKTSGGGSRKVGFNLRLNEKFNDRRGNLDRLLFVASESSDGAVRWKNRRGDTCKEHHPEHCRERR